MDSLYPFPDSIIILDRPAALSYAKTLSAQEKEKTLSSQETTRPSQEPSPPSQVHAPRTFTIWTDGSAPHPRPNALIASATRYLSPTTTLFTESVTLNTLPAGAHVSLEAEFLAVCHAFRIAGKWQEGIDRLVVLSDCMSVLEAFECGTKERFRWVTQQGYVDELFETANRMFDEGISVELRWVPGHAGVEGNERVDKLARLIRRSAGTILRLRAPGRRILDMTLTPESWDDLPHILLAEEMEECLEIEPEERGREDEVVLGDGVVDENEEVMENDRATMAYGSRHAETENPLEVLEAQRKALRARGRVTTTIPLPHPNNVLSFRTLAIMKPNSRKLSLRSKREESLSREEERPRRLIKRNTKRMRHLERVESARLKAIRAMAEPELITKLDKEIANLKRAISMAGSHMGILVTPRNLLVYDLATMATPYPRAMARAMPGKEGKKADAEVGACGAGEE
jgi:ribonuclease HI